MSEASRLLPPRSRRKMSRLSTGRKMIYGLDGRTSEARRFHDLCSSLAGDLGHEPSQAELALIRQAAIAIASSEKLQARAVMGECSAVELAELARLGNLATRTITLLKLNPKGDAGTDLQAYLAGKWKAPKP
jgi:hypothetical protein